MSTLARLNLLLVVALVAHTADHAFNQPTRHLAAAVVVPGLVGSGVALVSLALALLRNPLAAPLAVALGFGQAIGFVAVHLLPHWGSFSDPYSPLSLNALSWVLVVAPIAAALALGFAGLRTMPRRSAAAA
jgi:hypothetical protein